MTQILFRADASPAIGTGHIMRCLALADGLSHSGAEITFACRELPQSLQDMLRQRQYRLLPLLGAVDAQEEADCILQSLPQPPDWLIVDHYELDAHWELVMRPRVRHLLAIDDLCNRPHAADIVLDHNLSFSESDYRPLVGKGCRLLLGPRYALLREQFAGKTYQVSRTIRRVLVSFGGSDPGGELFKVMDAATGLPGIHFTFLAGQANLAWNALQQRAVSQPDWCLLRHVDNLAELMLEHDLFIGAAGGMALERAAIGLPGLVIAVADNQIPGAEAMAEAGLHHYLGRADEVDAPAIRAAVLAADYQQRTHWSAAGRKRVDGKGIARVVNEIRACALILRRVLEVDRDLLFASRNAPEIRRWALQTDEISRPVHDRWFSARLKDEDCLFLIGELDAEPVGVVRFDRLPQQTDVCVSIYLLPQFIGQGLGAALLRRAQHELVCHWPDVTMIRAEILPANHASLALFQGAGYQRDGEAYVLSIGDIRT
ncbi:UDP-2,4-diacetamido-2,4,6-trideoxy-beta-L-altropyranose hydrolase [Chitinilyticum aquatile]|uniref:UDP-2,4-diacetamido-2,4, 6-trideoxy-beta-L-altropyranose hydrolase n=1 Tax=Chitinilyticum aquatile TaxID=362520 RepID=UPI000686C8C4|nr:UDP-2,4-diacetamido-2,4,6-trideoxy-beta-L-altropyranose hydrolase [Chitinilyticum aquatile]